MIVSERHTDQGLLVTVCDADVLGESFEDEERGVSLTVTEEFYGGEEATPEEVEETLARASIGNLVGEEAVALAVDAGFVAEPNVLDVEDTRHAQFLRL
ncbi:DUF424 domain-containing protein [Halospeciosus flavus]|uniref:DUF424 domain-containing protein n=1 Tax=Halospeciosus flavus TaxID=3032283 RepID=A0ABD5Z7D4_9EURY|nr:DUF424 family protein [Halospeciosus flavus]